jgi:hypothetical protein
MWLRNVLLVVSAAVFCVHPATGGFNHPTATASTPTRPKPRPTPGKVAQALLDHVEELKAAQPVAALTLLETELSSAAFTKRSAVERERIMEAAADVLVALKQPARAVELRKTAFNLAAVSARNREIQCT